LQLRSGKVGGASTGSGSANSSGSVNTSEDGATSESSGKGEFTTSGGSSGFIDTKSGSAQGNSAAGATGSNSGTVGIENGGVGTLTFDGSTTSSGRGGFGGGFSPVVNTGSTSMSISGTPNSQGDVNGFRGSSSRTPTTFNPSSTTLTRSTGGFGNGSGALNIASKTGGTLNGDATTVGTGTSGGEATSFGEGSASGRNPFGTAGGAARGSVDAADAVSGTTMNVDTAGVFDVSGSVQGNFDNRGSGVFGRTATRPTRPTLPSFSFP
jgi:hypothetical protein